MSTTLTGEEKIKIIYKGETRKLSAVENFSELRDTLCQLLNLNIGSFTIKYKDEDDDLVNVENNDDYAMALEVFQSLNKAPRFEIESVVSAPDFSVISKSEMNTFTRSACNVEDEKAQNFPIQPSKNTEEEIKQIESNEESEEESAFAEVGKYLQ